nr:5-formyltetrahydrofolate cyclo-ligase [uncultured Cohaesibacter sp.]
MDNGVTKQLKSEARGKMRALRAALSPKEHHALSQQICENFLHHFDRLTLRKGAIIGLFLPIGSEINASLLESPLRERGCELALPITIGTTGMLFRNWKHGCGLIDAGYGTKGPDVKAREVLPECLVMPLLAFDRGCNRLGHGAGHYDRYISERIIGGTRPVLVGLAFGLQQLDKVPVGEYDLPLDAIVTEREIFEPA